ncbi:Sec-independent protein translocase subunit TatA/TatB [Terriglobus sp.]|uniref:Sec-independent protein translocase subunit TatA/TatB n=1 Tax=Terriglobus sp. TaxID=1889013 RepID=UPI003B008886
MFGNLFEGPHLIFIGVLLLLVFGGRKLPELGKGLGEGLRGFKDGMKGVTDDAKNDAHIITPDPKDTTTTTK